MSYTSHIARCSDCGLTFARDPEESWKRLCFSCWKRSKAKRPTTPTTDNALAESRAECARLRLRVMALELDIQRGSEPIPDDMLARLIRLCHPDRHDGSDAANKATAWLLAQRKEARR
ncbi:MAG TPA: hypothetical protein PLN31_19395 [Azoarcus taiwanensis]|nr:hypothetical protein [Azoarcus taiwanensis]